MGGKKLDTFTDLPDEEILWPGSEKNEIWNQKFQV